MRIASIDHVDSPADATQLPLEIRQVCALSRAGMLILLSLIAMATVLTPVVLIALDTVQHPTALLQIAGRPVSTLLLVAGVVIALALLVIPLRSGLAGFGRRRRLVVTGQAVKIEDKSFTGTREWGVPLAQFCGVAHHIRATLSGPRHEIILVHRDQGSDVLLQLGHRPPELGADHYARLLGVPEIPAVAVYERSRRQLDADGDVVVQSAAA